MEHQLLNEIIREVSEKGDYSVPLDSLKIAFGCDEKSNPCIKERLLLWAVKNQIIYVYREVDQTTVVRFYVRGRTAHTTS